MEDRKLIEQINANFDRFTKTQKKIANYICENYRQIPAMSVQEIADQLDTSDASIIRFAQSMGYKGYLDMRDGLKSELQYYYSPGSRFNRFVSREKNNREVANHSVSLVDVMADNDMQCHKEFYENFDRKLLDKIVKEINKAEDIHIVGFGVDSIMVTFLEWYLGLMGYRTFCYSDGGFATARRFGSISMNDLVIMFSTPRHLKIEKTILETANHVGACSVCITPDNILELSSYCDISITISERSNELINSYVNYMSLCNMIIMAVYESNEAEISKILKEREMVDEFFDILL